MAALAVAAGVALVVAPSLTALGTSGPPENYPGSIADLKPSYATGLIAAGVGIAVLAIAAAFLRRPALAGLACAIAVVAGISLDYVEVIIDTPVIYRAYSVFELRGEGPWVAAVACLAAGLGSAVLAGLIAAADD